MSVNVVAICANYFLSLVTNYERSRQTKRRKASNNPPVFWTNNQSLPADLHVSGDACQASALVRLFRRKQTL